MGQNRYGARLGSELRDASSSAVLVLLSGATADATGALDHAVLHDRHRALARDHVPALGGGDALNDRRSRALGEKATRSAEGGRGDRLALAAVDTCPDGAIHAIEGHQPAAGVAH